MSSPSSLSLLLFFLSFFLLLLPSHAVLQYTFHLTPNLPYRPNFNQRLFAGNHAIFNVSLAGVTFGTSPIKVTVSPLGSQLTGLYGDFIPTATATTARFRQAAMAESKATGDIPAFNFTATEAAGQSMLYITVSCPVGMEAACYFSIALTTHNRQHAWPGMLNFDKLPQGSTQYFDFSPQFYFAPSYPLHGENVTATLAADDIHITATVLRGRISIYVISTPLPGAWLPTPTNATWRVENYNNEVLLIPIGANVAQRNARISQQFIIAVVADDASTTVDKSVVYALQVSYRSLVRTDNNVPEAQIVETCRYLSDDIPTPGQSLAIGDWDEYCFVAPTPQCEMDVTMTTYGGEQDIYLWSNGGFYDAVFDTESDNLHKGQNNPTFYAIIIYTPNVTGRFTPGRYNILFHTNCTNETFTAFSTLSVEQPLPTAKIEEDVSSRLTIGQFRSQFREIQQRVEKEALTQKIGKRQGLRQSSGEGLAPPFIPHQADKDVSPPLSSVKVELKEDSPPSFPQSRHLMSYMEQELDVALNIHYHAIQLTQGQAQFGQLAPNRVMRYVYHPMSFNYDLTFELNRRSGSDPNLYVATSNFATLPFPTSAQWVSNFSGSDYITVDKMDSRHCATLGCFYHIAVFIDGNLPYTGYTLTVSEGEALTDLQSGQVYSNRLQANEPDYLRFVALQPGQAITFTLTDTGRTLPRMYIDTRTRFPNATFNQRSVIVGSDGNQESGSTIVASGNGGQSLGCNPSRTSPCYYYIQVISSGNTTYSIVVSAGGAIELRNAVYQEGRVTQAAYQYYKFIVSPGFTRFAVSMLLVSGQANMYVGRTEAYPSATVSNSFVVMREYFNLNTPITIYENNPALTCSFGNSTYCTFTIAVLGISPGTTTFALLATEGLRASVGVSNGLPIRQTMPINQTYYWWTKVEANTRMQICVTVISGTVSGYLSEKSDNVYPGPASFDQVLTIIEPGYRCVFDFDHPGGDIFWSLTNPSTQYGAQVSVMFLQQQGQNDTTAEVQLSDGFPQAAMLSGSQVVYRNQQNINYPANQLIYFNFLLAQNVQSLVIDLYAITGDADVYMTYYAGIPFVDLRYPSRQYSQWRSNLTGSDIITINTATAGRYIIAVFHTATSAATTVNFIITASTPLLPQSIQDGLGVRGYVGNNLYKFYVLSVSSTLREAIEIRLSPTRGNPDLYAARVPAFNLTTALWKSNAPSGLDIITISPNDPNRPTSGTWTLYIGVHSPSGVSEFTMVTSLTASSTFIQSNIAIPGVVNSGSYDYYKYRPANLSQPIDFVITRYDGGPWLVLSHVLERPTTVVGQYNYSGAWSSGNAYYRITPVASPRGLSCMSRNVTDPQDCIYYIGITNYDLIRGSSETLVYSLQVGQPNDVTVLVDRNALAGQVMGRELHHYQYVNTVLTRTIVFAVTAAVGDVDIYVATTPNAGPNNFLRSSTGSGDDVIVITNSNSLYYYIGVQNKLNSTSQYTLLGRAYVPGVVGSGAWTLYADQSYNDFCGRGDYSYYYFNIAGRWPTLTISVNARLGDPDIFVTHAELDGVSQWPNMTRSRWSADYYGSDTLTIQNPPLGTMYIAVYSAVNMDAFYTISITGEGRTQVMSVGVTYTGDLPAQSWQYYQLTLLSIVNVEQLVFSLTSRTGDADIYISDTHLNPSNVVGYFNWSSIESVQGVVDLIVIRNTTNAATGRPNLHAGIYYVGVYSYGSIGTSSSYSLYASSGQRTTLVDGRPITSSLTSGGSVIFEAIYGQGTSFSVQTQATSGMAPLWVYVSLQENIVIGRSTTYLVASLTNTSSVDLNVPGSSCTTMTCRYTILVHSPAAVPVISVSFSISTQTPSTITSLSPGVPQGGSVAGASYHYYTFVLNCPSNVSIFLTALSGNPDLYVNQGPAPPTRFAYIWQSSGVGLANDFVSFSPMDNYFRLNATHSMIGRYFIAVWGALLTSSYNIVLSIDNQCGTDGGGADNSNSTITYIRLTNGQPQYGRVAFQRWLYYSFVVTPAMWPTRVTFTLSPTDGSDPDMYVTKDGTVPSPDNHSWASELEAGNDDIISISSNATSPSPCIPSQSTCTYHIGIYGWTASSYTLTASTTGVTLGLQMDYSKDGGVGPLSWTYYSVRVDDSTQPLVIIVSPISGNPDVYVEFGAQPTLQSLTSKTFGVDVITIPEPSVGEWRIGVYGAAATVSTFSIVASQRGIDLRNGRPQDDVLTVGQSRYYFFEFNEVTGGVRPFRLQIDPISFNPQLDVYVSRNAVPSPTNNMFNFSSANGDALSLIVPYGNSQWRMTATWRVLVVSRSASAAYSITAAQGHPPIFLSDGRATDIGESVAPGEYRYFRMILLSNLYPVTVTVNVLFGGVSLFVSTQEPLPAADTGYLLNGTTAGTGGVISLTIPRTQLPGYIYASVRTNGVVAARYTILFSTGLTLVQAGVQSTAVCTAEKPLDAYVVYPPFNSSYMDDVTMRVASPNPVNYSRPLVIYVSTNASVPRASSTQYDWAFALLDWNNPFTISRNDVKLQHCVDRGNCELRISVGCQGAVTTVLTYLFSVQIGASYIPLTVGQSIIGRSLATDQDRYYTISTGSAGNVTGSFFQLRVEPCIGNVALFVNYLRSGIPTAGNNDASSEETRQAQSVSINSPIPTGRVSATLRGLTVKPATYQLSTWTDRPFEYFAPSTVNGTLTIWQANPLSVPDRQIKIYFLPARMPQAVTDGVVRAPLTGQTGYMKYTLYWAYEPTDAVMYTLCGMNLTTSALVVYGNTLVGQNVSVTFSVPSDVRRYSINIVAQYIWRATGRVETVATPGVYLVYRGLTSVLPGQANVINPTGDWPFDSSSSSSAVPKPPHPNDNANSESTPTLDKVVLGFAIGVPVTVAICAVLLFLHVRNQRMMESGGIELNERFDVGGSDPSSSNSTRPHDKFNRLVEDQQDTGGYAPPGGHGGAQFARGGVDSRHHDDTNGGGGGDYGGLSSQQVIGNASAGGWGHGSAMSHYAQHASGQDHDHISGRGFYEL